MSTIYGNPLLLGGGGVKLNIDYGTNPPSDTTKLWVPSGKPTNLDIEYSTNYGDGYSEWLTTPVLSMRQYYAGCFTYQDKMYLAGGYNGTSNLSQITEFDPVAGTVTNFGNYYQFSNASCIMDTQNGILYTFGNFSNIYKYDFNTKEYSIKTPTGSYYSSQNPGLAIVEGDIYIFPSANTTSIYKYNIATNVMTKLTSSMPTAIPWKCVYPGNGDYIYCYGVSGAYLYSVPFNFRTGKVANISSSGGGLPPSGIRVIGAVCLNNVAYVVVTGYATNTSNTMYNFSGNIFTSELKGANSTVNLTSNDIGIPALPGTSGNSAWIQSGCVGLIGTEIYIMGIYNSTTTNMTKICKVVINTALNKDNMRIQTATEIGKYPWLAINENDTKLKVSLNAVYKGNADNIAKQTDAYLYINDKWQTLTGKQFYALKGDLISMDLDGNGDKQYRILKINGSKAMVLGMHDISTSQAYNTTSKTGTFTNGTTGQLYAGSDLDTYLNTTWYNTLTSTAKAAIVPESRTQYMYQYYDEPNTPNTPTYTYQYQYGWSDSDYDNANLTDSILIGNRNIFALDLKDIFDYFGKVCITSNELMELWTNQTSAVSKYWWLSSAYADDPGGAWGVGGGDGYLGYYGVGGAGAVRPAFNLDLSKIPFIRV